MVCQSAIALPLALLSHRHQRCRCRCRLVSGNNTLLLALFGTSGSAFCVRHSAWGSIYVHGVFFCVSYIGLVLGKEGWGAYHFGGFYIRYIRNIFNVKRDIIILSCLLSFFVFLLVWALCLYLICHTYHSIIRHGMALCCSLIYLHVWGVRYFSFLLLAGPSFAFLIYLLLLG